MDNEKPSIFEDNEDAFAHLTEKIGAFVTRNNVNLRISSPFVPNPPSHVADEMSRVSVDGRDSLVNNMLNNRHKTSFAEQNVDKNSNIGHVETTEDSTKAAKKKKKKSRKKKKKNTKDGNPKTSSLEEALSKKSVQFSNISVREYRRCLESDGVPYDGGWPLGLSNEVVREYSVSGGIEEFEHKKQLELRERWQRLIEKKGKSEQIEPVDGRIFETRQFDFKKQRKHKRVGQDAKNPISSRKISAEDDLFDGKNPLFIPFNEDDRKKCIVRDFLITADDIKKGFTNEEEVPQHHNNKREKKSSTKRITRNQSSKNSEYDDTPFSAFDIRHIRNDLEQIRNNRNIPTGCSCRKPNFFLPFFTAQKGTTLINSRSKQKGHKLNDRRLKEELRKRGKLNPNQSRAEMEIVLGNAIETEPCCRSDSCECVKNGIECQADTCSCWHSNHQSNYGIPVTELPTPQVIKATCGNKHGIYVVDYDAIHNHRKPFICQEVP